MDETNRRRTWLRWMRDNRQPVAFDKNDLRAAIDATDDWIDANQASFNAALPQPFRSQATAEQKTLLFCYVAMRRRGAAMLRVAEDD
jgi:CBS-domain-containing membrane protein